MHIKKNNMDMQTVIILLLIGLVAGTLSGMVGIGGGIVIVPALVLFLGFNQLNAQGNSLAMIMLPVGFLGVIQYYKAGHVNYQVVIFLAVGFILGSLLGSKITLSLPQDTVKKIFAMLLIVIACKMLFFDKKAAAAQRSDKMDRPDTIDRIDTA